MPMTLTEYRRNDQMQRCSGTDWDFSVTKHGAKYETPVDRSDPRAGGSETYLGSTGQRARHRAPYPRVQGLKNPISIRKTVTFSPVSRRASFTSYSYRGMGHANPPVCISR